MNDEFDQDQTQKCFGKFLPKKEKQKCNIEDDTCNQPIQRTKHIVIERQG